MFHRAAEARLCGSGSTGLANSPMVSFMSVAKLCTESMIFPKRAEASSRLRMFASGGDG